MKYIVAFLPLLCGYILDLIFGDPYNMPHPVRLIGNLISKCEGLARKLLPDNLRAAGVILVCVVLTVSTVIPTAVLCICYGINMWLGAAVESVLIYYMLAERCLYDESMKVYKAIKENDIERARYNVSMIVGRDTDKLDESGIIRAAVETVAENTSDGQTAPLFYIALGGAAAGFFYKAANTMDSMIGYKNEKYTDLGRTAARLDDVLNFIPSRLSALMMIAAAFMLGYDSENAFRIWKRDRKNQPSPNAPQTETAAAGALGLKLLGDCYYFGELHHKNTIGDELRCIEAEDIRRVNKLMFATSAIMFILAVAVRCIIAGLMF